MVPFPVDVFIGFEGGTVSGIVTSSEMAASTRGASPGTWSYLHVGGVTTPLTHTYTRSGNFARRFPLLCNGVAYIGAGSKYLVFDTDGVSNPPPSFNGWDALKWTPAGTYASLTVSALMKFNLVADPLNANYVGLDHININASLGNFAVMQQERIPGGTNSLRAHGSVSSVSTKGVNIPITDNTLYEIYLRFASGFVDLLILDPVNGAVLGASRCLTDTGTVAAIDLQDYLSFFGGQTYWDSVYYDWTNAALPPVTVPNPSSVSVSQTNVNEVTVTWSGVALGFKIERSISGVWSTLAADQTITAANSYVDSGVSNGNTYTYRVTGNIGNNLSAVISGSPVTINNTLPTGTLWQQFLTDVQNIYAAYNVAGTKHVSQRIRNTDLVAARQITKISVNLKYVYTAGNVQMKLCANADGSGAQYGTSVIVALPAAGTINAYIDFDFFYALVPAGTHFWFRLVFASPSEVLLGSCYGDYYPGPASGAVTGYDADQNGSNQPALSGTPEDLNFKIYTV